MTVALALSALAIEPALSSAECRNTSVQSELTICAYQEFERADRDLNHLWARLIAKARSCDRSADCGRTASDQRSEEQILRKGQRAWVQFRDAQCEYEGLDERGGSMEPMTVNLCLARLTHERIKQLNSTEK